MIDIDIAQNIVWVNEMWGEYAKEAFGRDHKIMSQKEYFHGQLINILQMISGLHIYLPGYH